MLPWFKSSGSDALARTALSSQPSLEQAIDEVAGSLKGIGQADLALVFCSSSFASDLPRLLPFCSKNCKPTTGWAPVVAAWWAPTPATSPWNWSRAAA